MPALSHACVRLSMFLLVALGAAALFGPARGAAAPAAASPYFGRWTVAEDRPVFTARGRLYKTIDIASCGRDFCGVSVDDRGNCGSVLFRFLARHAGGDDTLRGHGKWGDAQKNIEIYNDLLTDDAAPSFELWLGDGHDFGGRSESMPKFHAAYRRLGNARCRVK
ncbi:hypothetical protein QH494_19015 [Sphingomonas sp. AR_OL41]|uniref:hypothetical protein n=1 Tax=Sphingomonas sp. AR_OL41 TaxID=3042729 RepID=UPI002481966F|nr:hypothetical protein [Sphingomonas sp. AR_OL41]MDH7974284.1 hypothetical protein [Sphingomonas sp. AR_OL41]